MARRLHHDDQATSNETAAALSRPTKASIEMVYSGPGIEKKDAPTTQNVPTTTAACIAKMIRVSADTVSNKEKSTIE